MYAKVFRSLWDGTLAESWQGWAVFVFLLAHADADGVVDMTPAAISRRSGLPMGEVLEGLGMLEAPDPASRSEAEEGRRLLRLDSHRDWGWSIVNYQSYRALRDPEMVRAQNRERQERRRLSRPVTPCHAVSRSVTLGHAPSRQAEVEAEVVKTIETSLEVSRPSGDGQAPKRTVPKKESPEDLEWRAAFQHFWEAYPRRQKRIPAERAWAKVPLRGQAGFDAISAGLERARRSQQWQDPQFIPLPASWLNAAGWEDEHPEDR